MDQTKVKSIQLKKLYEKQDDGSIKFVKSFNANGKEYFIEDLISIDRWTEAQVKQSELAFGMQLKTLMSNLRNIWDSANQQQFANVVVITHNLMQSVVDCEQRKNPIEVKLCALFINTEDEDRRYYDETAMDKKINDWKEEGIEMTSFFYLAVLSIPNFMPVYNSTIQDISQLKQMKTVLSEQE